MPVVENLVIERLVIHQVFERDPPNPAQPPQLSTTLSPLTPAQATDELVKRITDALGRDAMSTEMDIVRNEAGSTFVRMVEALEGDDAAFITASQKIAENLHHAQDNANIPGGIVAVATGTVGVSSRRYALIIKAELTSGFQRSATPKTISLQFLNDLVLTPSQKLYKIAILVEAKKKKGESEFEMTVFDNNIGSSRAHNAAKYFYSTFLGCAQAQNSRVLTERFHDLTTEFINKNDDLDSKQKVKLKNLLTTYLRDDQTPVFQLKEFADRYLPNNATRNQYSTFMAQKEFPSNSVQKDLTNIASRLRVRRIHFTSKVKLTAPAEEFDKVVKIIESDSDGFTTVKILGEVDDQQ